MPDLAPGGCVRRVPAPLCDGPRRAGRHDRHRRLAALSGAGRNSAPHDRRSQGAARARGDDPNKLLPAVHRVVSLVKRWLLGRTHHGSYDEAHLFSYLDEFVFRCNRRRSRTRGMVFFRVLELAVGHEPVRLQDLIANRRQRKKPPVPPQRRGHPASLERANAERPWRGPPCTPVKWIPQIQRIRPCVPVDKRAPAKHPNRVQLTFDAQTCDTCPLFQRCPAQRHADGDGYVLTVDLAEANLARRRRAEADGTFRPRYRIRAGIVATNWNSNVSTGSATCAFEDDRAWSSPSI